MTQRTDTTEQSDSSRRLPEGARAYLEPARFATIATLDPDGSPHQAVTWYALDGDALLINSRAERHWPRNLTRDPRISIAVHDLADPEHWLGLKGEARLIHTGAEALEDIMALARRYDSANPERFRGQDRVTYRITVERVFEYRG
jgi:PPOX class probable F420-dependent enzyme